MQYLCEYSKNEILTIVAEHAAQTLPESSDGVLRAILKKNNNDSISIEVFFLETQKESANN